MRFRLRLGASLATVLGALLLVGLVATPALAWHSTISVETECVNGVTHVRYTVESSQKDANATVHVEATLNDEVVHEQTASFGPGQNSFSDEFDLPSGASGTLTVAALAKWEGGEKSFDKTRTEVSSEGCEETSTTETPTTAPATTVAEATSTTAASVGAATSTTSGAGALPFTGANGAPLLIAGLGLLGGGLLILLASRDRATGRHAR
jgi:hypothetical protein